jgi:peptidoglycan hydrolase-like protein with peptidoglycan-binding domain
MATYMIYDPRQAIRELQTYLLEIAYAYPNMPKVTPTGRYSPRTADAVLFHQNRMQISPTGIVDFETWQSIASEYFRIRGERELRESPELPSSLPLSFGSVGHSVTVLQSTVNELREYYPELPMLAVTGSYRNGTAYAIGLLQRRYGLPESTVTDHITWPRIMRDLATREQISVGLNG